MNGNDWEEAYSSLPAWMKDKVAGQPVSPSAIQQDGLVVLVTQGALAGIPLWFVDEEIDEVHE